MQGRTERFGQFLFLGEAPVDGSMQPVEVASEHTLADGGAKWRQIMEGARTVFLSDGFDGASMNDIARAAGVSKGTLYVYFDSKERLFEALIREERKQQAERLVFPGDPGDARQSLREFGIRLIEMMTRPDSIAHLRVIIAATAKFPSLGRAFYEAGPCHGARKLAAQLIKLRDAGQLVFENPERTARHFVDLAKSGVFNPILFGAAETPSTEEIAASVDAAVEVFMRAYGEKYCIIPRLTDQDR
jgi:AcrR family transcriptional regulator